MSPPPPNMQKHVRARTRSVIVENLSEHVGVPIEKVLLQNGVVITQIFGQFRKTSSGNLLQNVPISLVSYATDVENDSIVRILSHGRRPRCHQSIPETQRCENFEGHDGAVGTRDENDKGQEAATMRDFPRGR